MQSLMPMGFFHVFICEWLFTMTFICSCCNLMFYDWSERVMGVFLAPQNIPRAISVLTVGNKVYCTLLSALFHRVHRKARQQPWWTDWQTPASTRAPTRPASMKAAKAKARRDEKTSWKTRATSAITREKEPSGKSSHPPEHDAPILTALVGPYRFWWRF